VKGVGGWNVKSALPIVFCTYILVSLEAIQATLPFFLLPATLCTSWECSRPRPKGRTLGFAAHDFDQTLV
jgi:hypothetical protein